MKPLFSIQVSQPSLLIGQKLHSNLPRGRWTPKDWSPVYCLPALAVRGSWNQEQIQASNSGTRFGYASVSASTVITTPNIQLPKRFILVQQYFEIHVWFFCNTHFFMNFSNSPEMRGLPRSELLGIPFCMSISKDSHVYSVSLEDINTTANSKKGTVDYDRILYIH